MKARSAGIQAVLLLLLSVLASSIAAAEPLAIEVTKAEALLSAGVPVITIEMSSASAAAFGELTRANVGRRMELRLDGVTVMAPLIREPILGGSAQISGLPDDVDPPALASRIAAGTLRVEVEIVGE
jgi:preprotein translocase subunit SecD